MDMWKAHKLVLILILHTHFYQLLCSTLFARLVPRMFTCKDHCMTMQSQFGAITSLLSSLLQRVLHPPLASNSTLLARAWCSCSCNMIHTSYKCITLMLHPLHAHLQTPPLELRFPKYPDLRVSTITPSSIKILQDAGAWGEIEPPYSAAFTDMQVRISHSLVGQCIPAALSCLP